MIVQGERCESVTAMCNLWFRSMMTRLANTKRRSWTVPCLQAHSMERWISRWTVPLVFVPVFALLKAFPCQSVWSLLDDLVDPDRGMLNSAPLKIIKNINISFWRVSLWSSLTTARLDIIAAVSNEGIRNRVDEQSKDPNWHKHTGLALAHSQQISLAVTHSEDIHWGGACKSEDNQHTLQVRIGWAISFPTHNPTNRFSHSFTTNKSTHSQSCYHSTSSHSFYRIIHC